MERLPIRSPFPGAACYFLPFVDSTQGLARQLAEREPGGGEAFPPGSLVAADEQGAGRGRVPGRSWASEPGKNLLFTIRLDPGCARLPALPIRIGLALLESVTAYAQARGARLPSPARIKWPNDLMLGDRKTAGILCEAASSGLYAGIGLNCNQLSFPPELEGGATSLARELGLEVERWTLLERFLEALKAELAAPGWRTRAETQLWKRGEAASFLPGLAARQGLPGGAGSEAGRGAAALAGTIEGLDEAGSLLFREEGASRAGAYPAGELMRPRNRKVP